MLNRNAQVKRGDSFTNEIRKEIEVFVQWMLQLKDQTIDYKTWGLPSFLFDDVQMNNVHYLQSIDWCKRFPSKTSLVWESCESRCFSCMLQCTQTSVSRLNGWWVVSCICGRLGWKLPTIGGSVHIGFYVQIFLSPLFWVPLENEDVPRLSKFMFADFKLERIYCSSEVTYTDQSKAGSDGWSSEKNTK